MNHSDALKRFKGIRSDRQIADYCEISLRAVQNYKSGKHPRNAAQLTKKIRALAKEAGIPLEGPMPADKVKTTGGRKSVDWARLKEEGDARKSQAQAKMAEMDEAEKAGELVSVAIIREERHQVAVGMRRVFDVLVRNLAALGESPDQASIRQIVNHARNDAQRVHTEAYRGSS